jgi:hypothetical protein
MRLLIVGDNEPQATITAKYRRRLKGSGRLSRYADRVTLSGDSTLAAWFSASRTAGATSGCALAGCRPG